MSAVLKEGEAPEGEVTVIEIDPKMTPGKIIEQMVLIRDERGVISKRDKELVELWRAFEARLIQIGDEQGMRAIKSDIATATITFETLPVLEDMDALWAYMKDNDAPHLLQRRVSSSAFRELQVAGTDVPGVSAYIQRKISLRKR